jgi:hypothetical protein
MNFSSYVLLFLICAILSSTQSVYADTVSVVIDNDAFAGRDGGGYTNGIRIGWLSGELDRDTNASHTLYASFMKKAVETIPFVRLDKQKKLHVGASLYQIMTTPSRITSSEPDYSDFPYSGYLRASFFLFELDSQKYDEYSFNIGVVGPISGAKNLQRFTHKISGDREPKGWDNQLDNYLTAGVAYEHGVKSWRGNFNNAISADWINVFRIELGNYYSGISGGTVWRFGKNYTKNFNIYYPSYPEIIGDNALLSGTKRDEGLGWSLSAGLFADATAYFYVIDAAKDYEIDRNIFSGSATGSGTLYFDSVEISLSMRVYTTRIKHSSNRVSYGTLSVLWHF